MKLFYSWQANLPSSTNRNFILKALEKAVRRIRDDESIGVEPRIDRDTLGVPGSPDIASTIFEKIDECDGFVADVSIINKKPRPTPNPNVLVELGYALKAKGSANIILVMNTAFGKPEDLPFDLRARRITSYLMTEQNGDRAPVRKRLEQVLESAIRSVCSNLKMQPGISIIGQSVSEDEYDEVADIDRQLAFKRERAAFSQNGLARAQEEYEQVCFELKNQVEDFNRRSSEVDIAFREDDLNHRVFFVRGISLVVSWEVPRQFAIGVETAELYLGLWKGRGGRDSVRRQTPEEIRGIRYSPDLDINNGIGWIEGKSTPEFSSSIKLAKTWFRRFKDQILET
jgi:hypothetical protein